MTDDLVKTIIIPSSSNVDAETDGKWMMQKHRKEGKMAKTNARLVEKSLVYSHSVCQFTPLKSQSKITFNPIIDGKRLATSNIIVSYSPDSHDYVTRKTHGEL